MRLTSILRQHTPLIRFLGKRTFPIEADHTPHPHPASPTHSLPESFASYRQNAVQHGSLKGPQTSTSPASTPKPSGSAAAQSSGAYGAVGGRSGRQLGDVRPKDGEVWDRSELPQRFRRTPFSEAEIEAIESGGATLTW
nr:hypothetical protein B0A51_07332 [Rachicladosporium sp. CCFEE 5018]OQO30994.1 hypothetical protein B0A51_01233 [Rachicladosporium sp. CCFEE 5018]